VFAVANTRGKERLDEAAVRGRNANGIRERKEKRFLSNSDKGSGRRFATTPSLQYGRPYSKQGKQLSEGVAVSGSGGVEKWGRGYDGGGGGGFASQVVVVEKECQSSSKDR